MLSLLLLALAPQGKAQVSDTLTPAGHVLAPVGKVLEMPGSRPVDIEVSRDGKSAFLKDRDSLRVIDMGTGKERQKVASPGGASTTGLAVSKDSSKVLFTNSSNGLHIYGLGSDDKYKLAKTIALPGPKGTGASFPCGIALSRDERVAYVALSRNNTVGVVDLVGGKLLREIATGISPYDVELHGGRLVVSNQGGRRPKTGEKTAPSAGTEAPVDERGVVKTGTVSIIAIGGDKELAQIEVGLQPCDVLVRGSVAYVANANADHVSMIDLQRLTEASRFGVKPNEKLPFGSMPNALALSSDSRTLFVANAGNNAIVAFDVSGPRAAKRKGFLPTGWYPVALAAVGNQLLVVNNKGIGSRTRVRPETQGWNSHDHRGSLQIVPLASVTPQFVKHTEKVRELARVPQMLRMWEKRGSSSAKPAAIPKELGDPSLIEHVIYVIKENRTYDQFFGDLSTGDRDPSLCIFGRKFTPNHHAIAEQFVNLDNYYCNGVLSADGHSWATEGNVTPYLEKAFGGFTRSYTFGDDPLTYSSTGFVWDHILAGGFSFRNYGEMNYSEPPSGVTYFDFLKARDEKRTIDMPWNIGVERLRGYSCREYPGWNMAIPDVYRIEQFLKEFDGFKKQGGLPNLTLVYLPQDHAGGPVTPAAHMADNDLAVGKLIEAVSNSGYWKKTVVFVNEDDPQAGFDHVDGHRSFCLVASPYAKRGVLVSQFYNQTSVLHTICRIFGLPPMNQAVASSPLMFDCFTDTPDLSPYKCLPNQVPIDERNPPKETLSSEALKWEQILSQIPLHRTGLKTPQDEDNLNRYLWHRMKGFDKPYPSHLAGSHGSGLEKRRLVRENVGG